MSAGTSGRLPGPPEDATHALRQAPTRAREHCERSLKSLCVAVDLNPRAGRVSLRPAAMCQKADQRAGCARTPHSSVRVGDDSLRVRLACASLGRNR